MSTAYDPLLGKIVVHGSDRESARRALVAALDDTAILGLTTNTGFLRVLAASAKFRDAAIDTAWLDRHEVAAPDPALARVRAAWEVHLAERDLAGPFRADGFRLGGPPAPVVVALDEPVTLDGAPPADHLPAVITRDHVEVVHHGQRFVFARPDVFRDHAVSAGDGTVTAPMPGTVLEVRATPGRRVAEGDVLALMEAMKMELALRAPFAGTVSAVDAAAGDQVALGAVLVTVDADPEAAEAAP